MDGEGGGPPGGVRFSGNRKSKRDSRHRSALTASNGRRGVLVRALTSQDGSAGKSRSQALSWMKARHGGEALAPSGHPGAWQITRLHSRRYGHTHRPASAGRSGLVAAAPLLPPARAAAPRPRASKTATGCPIDALIHQKPAPDCREQKAPRSARPHHQQPRRTTSAPSESIANDRGTPSRQRPVRHPPIPKAQEEEGGGEG
jgi:hypothetical protein